MSISKTKHPLRTPNQMVVINVVSQIPRIVQMAKRSWKAYDDLGNTILRKSPPQYRPDIQRLKKWTDYFFAGSIAGEAVNYFYDATLQTPSGGNNRQTRNNMVKLGTKRGFSYRKRNYKRCPPRYQRRR